MTLADRIAQSRAPLLVQRLSSGRVTQLNGPAECAQQIKSCPLRFALSDELTRLCTALAYSKGARTLDCADLLHVPAEWVWVEWCQQAWEHELALYRFRLPDRCAAAGARRGALIRSSPDGRRGTLRTFWTSDAGEALASSMEAFFDFDTAAADVPQPPDGQYSHTVQVTDRKTLGVDVLGRCFRMRYEHSWREYYRQVGLDATSEAALTRHALGTIAVDIPVVLVFFLLLVPVLQRLLLAPLLGVLDEREERIEGTQTRAAALNQEAEGELARHEAAVRAARAEAERAFKATIAAAQAHHAESIDAARSESAQLIESARQELSTLVGEARQVLLTQTRELAREAAGRILGRSLS